MSQTVIRVENISKQYRLGVIGSGTLRDDLARFWAKVRGKEDPTLKIGQVNDRSKAAEGDYVWALKEVSFEVQQGEVLGIIGKNGAGKSTLLKILSRITTPTTGSIKMRGRVASLLEVGTGMHPELTGRENIFLNGAILGMQKAEIRKKLDEIIDFAGIAKYVDTPIKRYSSGMSVRLGFAVAAFLEPEILIVDEVLAVGDAEFQKKAIGKMQDISKGEGRTVLFVSHNMGSVKSLCTRAMLLANGSMAHPIGMVEEVVDFYYRKVGSNRSKDLSRWEGKFENELFTLNSLFIVDKDDNVLDNPFASNTPVYLVMRGKVKQQEKKLQFGYAVYRKQEETPIYHSFHTDSNKTFLLKEGDFELKTQLPTRFFNEGQYRVEFLACLHMAAWLIEPEEFEISIDFEIIGGLSDSPYWIQKRRGIMAPVLEWNYHTKA
jgi:lipopolysaccharide transport system ATP-binding protein